MSCLRKSLVPNDADYASLHLPLNVGEVLNLADLQHLQHLFFSQIQHTCYGALRAAFGCVSALIAPREHTS